MVEEVAQRHLADQLDDPANGGNGAWVRFNDGTLGVLNLNAAGTRGGGSAGGSPRFDSVDELPDFGAGLTANRVDSKRALLLNPFDATLPGSEIKSAFAQMQKNACPAYTVEANNVLNNHAATLKYYRRMYDYGLIATATHGDAVFGDMKPDVRKAYGWPDRGSEEVVWTGHKINCGYFKTATAPKTCSEKKACGPESECFLNKSGGNGVCVDHLTADLARGRVVYGADGKYGILPSFVRRHAESPYPQSLGYLGAGRALCSGAMAAEFCAAGAYAVVGYNGYTTHDFATKWGTTFFANIISQKQHSGVAHVKIEDTANPGTFFSLVGAQNLDASYSDIINRSWESGNLNGWLKGGDGRVIPKLGATVPVGGKFMSIISTGLGYTTQTGEIKQKFCIQPGKTKLTFWWKYYSEEFEEFCGSQYQDKFTARIESKVANKTMVDVTVDSLCKKGKCSKCGTQFKGLTPADVSFDKGGVFMTPWVLTSADVTPFAGNGSINLRLFTTDVGDSIYDTAILIDKIEFK